MHVTHTTANALISCVRWLFHILFTVYVNVIMMELPFVIGAVYRYYEGQGRILNDMKPSRKEQVAKNNRGGTEWR